MAAKPIGALDPRLLFGLPVAVADARRQPGGGIGLPAMRPTAAE